MGRSASQMVALAKATIENLSPDEVATELETGTALLIDVREQEERQAFGRVPVAHHVPRGVLEFHADPSSPWYRGIFAPDRRYILMCDTGGRSALATRTLQEMGYTNVAYLDGGFAAWVRQGLPTQRD
jgi:rhodanese-related sulfurtransferase